MTWDEAYAILKPIPTPDYIGGEWAEIRYHKIKALFDLAQEVKPGTVIVDLGTWRGLAAFAMALGADPSVHVHTFDDYGDRRLEEVADVKLHYNPADLTQYLNNLAKLPQPIQDRIHQHPTDVRAAAKEFPYPVGMLFWDIWGERIIDDIKAWLPHVVEGGIVATKVFEDGRLRHERLYDLPELMRYKDFPDGAVFSMRRTGQMVVKREVTGRVIWMVDGKEYVAEAERSANSVAEHMPQLEQIIGVPETRAHEDWFLESTYLLRAALGDMPEGERVLWLDSDTYMLESVPELFEMLDKYDLVFSHAPGHRTAATLARVPDSFPEPQIGVIAMRNTKAMRAFWEDVYQRQTMGIATDQAAMREALWENDSIRYAVIPCEYDFRFQFGGQIRDRVKILHGHAPNVETYEAIGRSVNAGYLAGYQLPPRLWGAHVLR